VDANSCGSTIIHDHIVSVAVPIQATLNPPYVIIGGYVNVVLSIPFAAKRIATGSGSHEKTRFYQATLSLALCRNVRE